MDLTAQVITQLKTMSDSELRALNSVLCDEIKHRHNLKNNLASAKLRVGDKVEFQSKRGRIQGTVTQINPKTIHVDEANGWMKWKVSPSLLKVI